MLKFDTKKVNRMKKVLRDFFKSKLNIILTVLQSLAIVFLCLCAVWSLAIVFMLIFEGLFFVFFGVKNLQKNKKLDEKLELINKISIEKLDMEKEAKKNKFVKKSNVTTSIIYFIMGGILIIIAIF